MMTMLLLAVLSATESGLDVGRVVDHGVVHENRDAVDSTGTPWVRINLRLDDWDSPTDDWFAVYDRVIDDYLARGIQVYALINDEAVASSQPHGSNAWIDDYVHNAIAIIDHFKNRVRVFELVNEPNNWADGETARFPPRAFAKILQDTYLAVKRDHAGDRCWNVDLISGPLFSFDGTSASDYLEQTYSIGTSELAWNYTHEVTGSYPLDGIGYHVYVAQGLDSTTADVRGAMLQNLSAVWNVVAAHEGATTKQLWVSEYGWEASVVGDDVQADRLRAGFSAMNQFGKVALALYFNFQDFPGATYGVFDDADHRRPSADAIAALANTPRAARLVTALLPTLAPGELRDAVVTLQNRGTATWRDSIRLAAAPGCPEAAHVNAIAWEPAAGYANDIIDARVFLPHDVAPGETIEVRVPVRAPSEIGEHLFAARMVDEGTGWFGPTISGVVNVAPTASEPQPDQACGCSTGRSAPGALLVLLFKTRRRRARHS